jgi:RHS repeat-associated protein
VQTSHTTTYVSDGGQVIEEYEGGQFQRFFVYGIYIDDPIMLEDNAGNRFYYLKDRQYSVTALTDANGTIVETYEYTAFGLMTIFDSQGGTITESTVGNPYGYTGRRRDGESGLWHYRNRMYSAKLGRFLQRDPAGYVDGLNLYAYVRNNPLRYLDPEGLTAVEEKANSNVATSQDQVLQDFELLGGVDVGVEKYRCDDQVRGNDSSGLVSYSESLFGNRETGLLNIYTEARNDLKAGTLESVAEASLIHVGWQESNGKLTGAVDAYKWRVKVEGGIKNYVNVSSTAKIAAIEGETRGTVRIGKYYFKGTLGGTVGSAGYELKVGLNGFKIGVHAIIGITTGFQWGSFK